MYVDDMIIYCIGELVDFVINMFNNVLKELEDWSLKNNLVFYFKKCEVMMLKRGSFIGLFNVFILCNYIIKWVMYV